MRLLAAALSLFFLPLAVQAVGQAPSEEPAPSAPAQDIADIRARRIAYNEAIAARRPDLMASFITENMAEMVSSAGVNQGRAAVIADYEKVEFKDPDFTGYDRRTDSIDVDPTGTVAAERGHWRARVRDKDGRLATIGGFYQAGWIKRDGTWLVRTEAYVMTMCPPIAGCR